MAIQPQFAEAILNGSKRIEFRKRRLASDIDTVLIYESAPTQRIVGHFTIERTELASPPRLWRSYGAVGSIRRADYLNYFGDNRQAVGLVIRASERYGRPVALDELELCPSVPQSFVYLPHAVLAEIQALQRGAEHSARRKLEGASTLPAVLTEAAVRSARAWRVSLTD